MAFSLTDFKKTSRTNAGQHVLYPHQLRDDRFLAAIAYAIDYYERLVGRPRSEMQADTLMEFFGDPKLARGVVACLSRSYIWHQPSFPEVLAPEIFAAMAEQRLITPADLRAYLYRYVNVNHAGYLSTPKRTGAIQALCTALPITSTDFEHLLTLDTPANAIMTKITGTPDARDIVAAYNYHSLETPLRYAESLCLTVRGDLWPILRTVHNIARRYGLHYVVEHDDAGMLTEAATITWRGTRDALGSYRSSGRRIVRALLRLLAVHSDAPIKGEALVHLRSRTSHVVLDKRALKTLGAQVPRGDADGEAWEESRTEEWRTAWSRAFFRGETGGWRMRRDPEPLVTDKGVIVPDFGLQRGAQRAALVLADTSSAVEALLKPLQALGGRSLVVVVTPKELARRLAGLNVVVIPSGGTVTPGMLATALPSPRATAEQHTTMWQRLEQTLAIEGFVDEGRIGEILDLTSDQIEPALRSWQPKQVTYLPGIGLCTSDTVAEIRALLQPERRRAA